jgi:hypothetical protein
MTTRLEMMYIVLARATLSNGVLGTDKTSE